MEFIEVAPAEYARLSSWFEPLLKRALAEAEGCENYEWSQLDADLTAGKVGLVAAIGENQLKAVCALRIISGARQKYAEIMFVAGNGLTDWIGFIDIILSMCKARGCSYVEGTGRPGWEKVLAPYGFTRVATTVRKRL